MKDNGSMARLPDLLEFAAQHGLRIGTIADLIEYRSANESIVRRIADREIETVYGRFRMVAYRDTPAGGTHVALTCGEISAQRETLVRVHEPLLDPRPARRRAGAHTWSIAQALAAIREAGCGVTVLLNCAQADEALEASISGGQAPRTRGP
jgi:3,4-dihydroxy 2-butanone 4-phosphate synthase/GTP cyclohydrolase II